MIKYKNLNQWGIGRQMILLFVLISIIFCLIEYFFLFNYKLNNIVNISNFVFYIIGIIWFILGIPIWFLGAKTIGKEFKEGKLITTSIFRYIQHPIYCGFILFYIPAILFMLKSWTCFILPFVFYLIFRKFILIEEIYLETKFGKEYLDYKRKTGKIIPKIFFNSK